MLGQVDAHGLGGHLVLPDGLKGAAVGGVDQQHDDGDADHRHQHGDKGRQAEHHLAGGVLDVEVGEGGETFQHIGAVGDGAQGLPLENGAEDLRKAQGRNGKVVALEPQDRQADEVGKARGHQAGQDQPHQNAQHHADAAAHAGGAEQQRKGVLQGEFHRGAAEQVVNGVFLVHRDGENGVGISAQQHEARLPQREQAGEAVEQVHRNHHQRVDGALFQHREQLAGGLQDAGRARHQGRDVLQQDDEGQEHHHACHRAPAEGSCLFHGGLLTLCRSPFRRTDRWA